MVIEKRKSTIFMSVLTLLLSYTEFVAGFEDNNCKPWCTDDPTSSRQLYSEIIEPKKSISSTKAPTINKQTMVPTMTPTSESTLIMSSPIPLSINNRNIFSDRDDERNASISLKENKKNDKEKSVNKRGEKGGGKYDDGNEDEGRKSNKEKKNSESSKKENEQNKPNRNKGKDASKKGGENGNKKGKEVIIQSNNPSENPTSHPTLLPTNALSVYTTSNSSNAKPTLHPFDIWSATPTIDLYKYPSNNKSTIPTNYMPSSDISSSPSSFPTETESEIPTKSHSVLPSSLPTNSISDVPSTSPTNYPTTKTYKPSFYSSTMPSNHLSDGPSNLANLPSSIVSTKPTSESSSYPTKYTSHVPSFNLMDNKSSFPSNIPSNTRSLIPSVIPTGYPSVILSPSPTARTTSFPSPAPSKSITETPTRSTTYFPSNKASSKPSNIISMMPSQNAMSSNPSISPSLKGTLAPTYIVSQNPTPNRVPTPLPSHDTCKPWCYTKPEPWVQKCNWKKNCSSCPECLAPTPPPSSPPCRPWCESNSAPWTDPDPNVSQKCRWLYNCSGCPQCGSPSDPPSQVPTMRQSLIPSIFSSDVPTLPPFEDVTHVPSASLTRIPTRNPTIDPTIVISSKEPSLNPTKLRTVNPTKEQTMNPSMNPSTHPTNLPTVYVAGPSNVPSVSSTQRPSLVASSTPSTNPTKDAMNPSKLVKTTSTPSITMTSSPSLPSIDDPIITLQPTNLPTVYVAGLTNVPSASNTQRPSVVASSTPTSNPTKGQTVSLSMFPSYFPSPKSTELYTLNATLYMGFQSDGNMTEGTTAIFESVTRDFLSDLSLDTDNVATVNVVEVEVVNQVVIGLIPGESLQLLSANMFYSLLAVSDVTNRRLRERSESFLLLEVIVRGEIVTIDASPFPFESQIRESMEDKLGDYADNLIAASTFFENTRPDDVQSSSLMIESNSSTVSDPVVATSVAVGGFVGTLAMLSAGFMLIRRRSSRSSSNTYWEMKSILSPSFVSWAESKKTKKSDPRHALDDQKRFDFMPNPNIDDNGVQYYYPRSINVSSQDSFSTLTFRENYKDGVLIPQREDSSVLRKDSIEPWKKTNLAYISESSSTSQDQASYGSRLIESPNKPAGDDASSTVSDPYGPSIFSRYKESPSSSISIDSGNHEDVAAPQKNILEVRAPPGPLGLVVESSDVEQEGPVVCEIGRGSSLYGLVELDDVILSVNDVDTRYMSTGAFARYMVQNERLSKRITVLRSKTVGNSDELMSL